MPRLFSRGGVGIKTPRPNQGIVHKKIHLTNLKNPAPFPLPKWKIILLTHSSVWNNSLFVPACNRQYPDYIQVSPDDVQVYTVQTVDLLLPCIGRIPQLHSCIEKKILLNSLCWLGGKFMLSSSKQVGTGPWFESRTWHKIYVKFFKDKLVWIYLWQGLLYFKD